MGSEMCIRDSLEGADSVVINFLKLLLNGTGGALYYVSDKNMVTESFGADALKFTFHKNFYTD